MLDQREKMEETSTPPPSGEGKRSAAGSSRHNSSGVDMIESHEKKSAQGQGS